jgi:hypothetical protein
LRYLLTPPVNIVNREIRTRYSRRISDQGILSTLFRELVLSGYQLIMSGTTVKTSLENGEVLSRTKTSIPRVSYDGNDSPLAPVVSAHQKQRDDLAKRSQIV